MNIKLFLALPLRQRQVQSVPCVCFKMAYLRILVVALVAVCAAAWEYETVSGVFRSVASHLYAEDGTIIPL